jgi:hypothetical protein
MNALPSVDGASLPPIQPGRFCPSSYALGLDAFRAEPEFDTDLIYVVGGLYGNSEALRAIIACFDAEPADRKLLCFNGDFHWFDRDPDCFAAVEEGTRPYLRLRGNVETELASDDDAAGCGCAYPDSVAQDRIEQTWREELAQRMETLGVQLFASSHTCLPVASSVEREGRTYAVINNGAAGMGNFRGDPNGMLTRIACPGVAEPPIRPLYRTHLAQCRVEALPVVFDHPAWQARFRAMWPLDSEAHRSYGQRILNGPAYELPGAVRGQFHT